MKSFSLILNGILAIAVAILFYQVNSLKKSDIGPLGEPAEISQKHNAPSVINSSTTLSEAKIAYVNTDSLNEHYAYIADFTKVLRGKKATLEAQMESMTSKFQNDYQTFQQSVQTGIAPQAELVKQEAALKRQQQDLANKELQMQNLAIELEEKNAELHKTVKDYLKTFNNGKFDYILSYSELVPTVLLTNPKLDITAQVLKGLNDEYQSKKQKK